MDPCVYTTQHGRWLHAAVGDWPTPVCFRSGKRWKKAHQLLTPPATLPVLFREQDKPTPVLACRFVADLVEIIFVADHLATDRARRAELQERLWLQRDTMIKSVRGSTTSHHAIGAGRYEARGWRGAYFSQPILEGDRSLCSPAPSPPVPRQRAQSANSLGKWRARQDSNLRPSA